jgi:signal transduction histidine kinase
LELEPFFWQRRWFLPLCGVVLLVMVVVLYRLRLREERQRIATIFGERGRIARELHDTLIQGFSGVTMEMQAFLGRLRSEDDKRGLSEIIRDAGVCLREARRSIAGLRQLDESHTGFAAMVASAARELTSGKLIRLQLRIGGKTGPLPAEVEYNLIRIVREAIANTLRHAEARNVEVVLENNAERILLEVRDDGRGFDVAAAHNQTGHFGLVGMRERAAEIGATVEVASEAGRGTVVQVTMPVKGDMG